MRRLNYSELGVLRLIIISVLIVSLTDILTKPESTKQVQCTVLEALTQ